MKEHDDNYGLLCSLRHFPNMVHGADIRVTSNNRRDMFLQSTTSGIAI